MGEVTDIHMLLQKISSCTLIDVRSESEYKQGHIPGAFNIPILNDEQRKIVGTIYKQLGQQEAVIKGFELVGPRFRDLFEKCLSLKMSGDLLVYCWRGGMRSNIVAYLLTLAGMKPIVLKGGYKSFRRWTIQEIKKEKKITVLGGATGVGKTDLLELLRSKGEQVINLEKLANHKGSAFGALGMEDQPSNEYFENLIALEWSSIKGDATLWLENESRMIGKLKIPDTIYNQMRSANLLDLYLSKDIRIKRILREYGGFSKSELAECTLKLKKRLGDLRLRTALKYLEDEQLEEWLNVLLEMYDRQYKFDNESRLPSSIVELQLKSSVPEEQVLELIAANKDLK